MTVALVAAMIPGTIIIYLALAPGECRRSSEFYERQRLGAEYLKSLGEERKER